MSNHRKEQRRKTALKNLSNQISRYKDEIISLEQVQKKAIGKDKESISEKIAKMREKLAKAQSCSIGTMVNLKH